MGGQSIVCPLSRDYGICMDHGSKSIQSTPTIDLSLLTSRGPLGGNAVMRMLSEVTSL